jgi:hypothetical protein
LRIALSSPFKGLRAANGTFLNLILRSASARSAFEGSKYFLPTIFVNALSSPSIYGKIEHFLYFYDSIARPWLRAANGTFSITIFCNALSSPSKCGKMEHFLPT